MRLGLDRRQADSPTVPSLCAKSSKSLIVRFSGNVMQQPPDHSAFENQGQASVRPRPRPAERSRLAPRMVQIDRIAILGVYVAGPGARDRLHKGHVHPLDCPRRRRGARLRRLRAGARAHPDRTLHVGGSRESFRKPFSGFDDGRLLRPPLEAVGHLEPPGGPRRQAQIAAVIPHGRTIALAAKSKVPSESS